MAIGEALIVGIGHVDAEKYGGWDGALGATERDANAIDELAQAKGFSTTKLLTADATSEAVRSCILAASERVKAGDIFLFYYSGHGGTVADKSGDEEDQRDETMCLYDRHFFDDELGVLWPEFDAGVRVLVIADCCHSGSITREASNDDLVVKAMDDETTSLIDRYDNERYEKIKKELPEKKTIQASVKLLSGCMDTERSYESKSKGHGQLTGALLDLMKADEVGNYQVVRDAIVAQLNGTQTPQLDDAGERNPSFDAETPLTI